jgi:hypothetical protein
MIASAAALVTPSSPWSAFASSKAGMSGERKGNAAFALADLLSRRGLERTCEVLVTWAREA